MRTRRTPWSRAGSRRRSPPCTPATSLQAYRDWLPATGYEGSASIGGSFDSPDIEDYYFTPWDLGYGHLVKFDHDFIGREALERMVDDDHRHKVTLALENDDVLHTIGTMLEKSGRGKFIDWPSAVYSMHPFDKVTVDGEVVGVSTWIGYSANEGKMLTLAVLDAAHAEPGTEVTFVWGEPDGGSSKPTVERHVQTEIRGDRQPGPLRRGGRGRSTRRAAGARRRRERARRRRHVVAAASGTRPRIRSAAFSAIIIVGACVLERVIVGITDASTTRSPSTP